MFLVLDFELPMNWVPWWRMLGSGLLRTRNYLHTRSTRRSTLKSMSSKSVRSRLGGLRSCLLQFLFPWRSMCTFTGMHVRSVIQVPAHRLFFFPCDFGMQLRICTTFLNTLACRIQLAQSLMTSRRWPGPHWDLQWSQMEMLQPLLWPQCRILASLSCSILKTCCCFECTHWIFFPRKGPIERVQFPTMSSVISPFQQLGQYILILGRKIDSAQELKDSWYVCASIFGNELCMCIFWETCALTFLWQEKLEKYSDSNGKAKELQT